MEKLVLYDYFRSSASFRVRAALHYKQMPYTPIHVHLVKSGGEHLLDPYLSLNPMAEVPCLVHGTKVLAQSMAIIHYIEDLKPQPRLLPSSSWDRAQVMQIAETVNSGIHPLQNLKVLKKIQKDWDSEEKKKEWAQYWIHRGLLGLEKLVARTAGTYAFGSQFSIADLYIVPQLYNARRFKVDLSQFTYLRRIESHCLEMDCFKKSLPESQPDFTPEK